MSIVESFSNVRWLWEIVWLLKSFHRSTLSWTVSLISLQFSIRSALYKSSAWIDNISFNTEIHSIICCCFIALKLFMNRRPPRHNFSLRSFFSQSEQQAVSIWIEYSMKFVRSFHRRQCRADKLAFSFFSAVSSSICQFFNRLQSGVLTLIARGQSARIEFYGSSWSLMSTRHQFQWRRIQQFNYESNVWSVWGETSISRKASRWISMASGIDCSTATCSYSCEHDSIMFCSVTGRLAFSSDAQLNCFWKGKVDVKAWDKRWLGNDERF